MATIQAVMRMNGECRSEVVPGSKVFIPERYYLDIPYERVLAHWWDNEMYTLCGVGRMKEQILLWATIHAFMDTCRQCHSIASGLGHEWPQYTGDRFLFDGPFVPKTS